ncbi:hypothetical protein POM88_051954 [Heracleum sosnowskyi]|uniref:Transposase n=1 Tax=Heracleum sosnowskyi TaxID=360622 RepID=A0AAD8GSA2_9APIA|nr:hypothetical protein POM88_051954 [Heracleum sosnowskyi]
MIVQFNLGYKPINAISNRKASETQKRRAIELVFNSPSKHQFNLSRIIESNCTGVLPWLFVFEYLKIKRKKELEFGKDWVFKEERSKRIKQDRRLVADDAAIGKKSKMSIDEMCEELKLSIAKNAARLEGKVVDEDTSMFRQDIDVYAGALVPKGTGDAYRSVSDKIMNTDFFKTDKSSIGTSDQTGPGDDDPAEFHMEPQGSLFDGHVFALVVKSYTSSSESPQVKATVVICPLAAVVQRVNEIAALPWKVASRCWCIMEPRGQDPS